MVRTREQLTAELEQCIATDSGLPVHWYHDEEIHKLEQELIFRKSWYHIGHRDELAKVGDFITSTIAGASILITRTRDDEIKGFFNTCRHRGHIVESRPQGNAKTLMCRYHGWNYELDGSLRTAPYADEEVNFDKCMFALTPIKVDFWGPLIFANLDIDAPALMKRFEGLADQGAAEGWTMGEGYRQVRRPQFIIDANWKIAIDNSIECTHCTLTHPNFARTYNVKLPVYKYHALGNYSYQWGPAQVEQRLGDYQQWYMYPGTLPVRSGGAVYDIWNFLPETATTTRAIGTHYFHESMPEEEIEAYFESYTTLLAQDRQVMEDVQRGLNPAYSGPLSRNLVRGGEYLLRHMQELMLADFRGAPTSDQTIATIPSDDACLVNADR